MLLILHLLEIIIIEQLKSIAAERCKKPKDQNLEINEDGILTIEDYEEY